MAERRFRLRDLLRLYALAVALSFLVPPWKASYEAGGTRASVSRGYAPVWEPPIPGAKDPGFYRYVEVNVPHLAVQLLALTAVAAFSWLVLTREPDQPNTQ
jgi:hypothetical protein